MIGAPIGLIELSSNHSGTIVSQIHALMIRQHKGWVS